MEYRREGHNGGRPSRARCWRLVLTALTLCCRRMQHQAFQMSKAESLLWSPSIAANQCLEGHLACCPEPWKGTMHYLASKTSCLCPPKTRTRRPLKLRHFGIVLSAITTTLCWSTLTNPYRFRILCPTTLEVGYFESFKSITMDSDASHLTKMSGTITMRDPPCMLSPLFLLSTNTFSQAFP